MDRIVEASGVRKVYRGGAEVEALKGVSLEVARGEMVAPSGENEKGFPADPRRSPARVCIVHTNRDIATP